MTTPADAQRYRFGPLDRRGLVAGWRGGQIAVAGTGLATGLALLRSEPSAAGLFGAIVLFAASIVIASWPVGGRTVEQWAPVALRWVSGGRRALVSSVPRAGTARGLGEVTPDLPRPLSGCRLLAAGPGSMGVVHDCSRRSYTAVVSVRGHSFSLLGPDEQHRRIAGWAGVLSALAREGSSVHRLQWLERSLPHDDATMHSYLAERGARADGPARRSYEELLAGAAPVTRRHQVLVALTLDARRCARASARALHSRASTSRDAAACDLLQSEVHSLVHLLGTAEVVTDGALPARSLARALRQAIEWSPVGAEATAPVGAGPGSSVGWPWPVATQAGWSAFRTDATWHATYWVSEWPRLDVGPDFLAPLLLQTSARRTVSVTMEPVSPARAVREVEQARTADLADSELRRHGGFTTTARRRREEENLRRRELELADGHAQYRFSGYVTVTAPSRAVLDRSCAEVEQAAGQSRLELRRLFGEQDHAFTYTLPLGRGLS